MLCLDTFIPSGALDNIPHTINKTMDIPVTFLSSSREWQWGYATGRQKEEDGKTLVCDKRDKAITCVLCRDHVFWSLQKDMFKARKVKFGEKLFQTVYYYRVKNFCNLIGL